MQSDRDFTQLVGASALNHSCNLILKQGCRVATSGLRCGNDKSAPRIPLRDWQTPWTQNLVFAPRDKFAPSHGCEHERTVMTKATVVRSTCRQQRSRGRQALSGKPNRLSGRNRDCCCGTRADRSRRKTLRGDVVAAGADGGDPGCKSRIAPN